MKGSGGSVGRTATLVAVAAQIAGVVALVVLGAASDGPLLVDWKRPLTIAAVYLLPAVLAVVSLRGRGPLLLAAATTALVMAELRWITEVTPEQVGRNPVVRRREVVIG